MICSKDPLFPLAVLVELCPFLQRQHFSCSIVFLLFCLCFFYIYNVATFILLSDDSDSNCFLFPLKMHTRTGPNKQTGIRSQVLHVVAFVVVVVFRPPPSKHQNNLVTSVLVLASP